jgi:hypothetical protein
MASDSRPDDASRRALEDLVGDQAGPLLARAEKAAADAPPGMEAEAYAAVLVAAGIDPDIEGLRLTFGSDTNDG